MEKFTEIYKSRSDDCYYPQESVDIMAHEEIGADDLMGGHLSFILARTTKFIIGLSDT